MLDDGEAEAGAAEFPAAGFVHPVKPLENPRQMLRRDAGTIVGHADFNVAGFRHGAHADAATGGRVLDCVVEQVDETWCNRRASADTAGKSAGISSVTAMFFSRARGLSSSTAAAAVARTATGAHASTLEPVIQVNYQDNEAHFFLGQAYCGLTMLTKASTEYDALAMANDKARAQALLEIINQKNCQR